MCSGSAIGDLIKRGDRHDVDLAALAFRNDGTNVGVTLRNLSYNGCLLEADAAFRIGEKVRIAVPRMGEIRAQVRWTSNAGQAGAIFVLEELSPDEHHIPPVA